MRRIKLIYSMILVIVVISITSTSINAQDRNGVIYETTRGTIQIIGVLNDTVILAESNELSIFINFETAQFLLILEKSTLRTKNDSINNLLSKLADDFLHYEGKLGVDYINTEKHGPQDFEVEGFLTCAPHFKEVFGKGHIEHVFGDVSACILNITFYLSLKDLNINLGIDEFEDEIQVEIRQTLIKRDK